MQPGRSGTAASSISRVEPNPIASMPTDSSSAPIESRTRLSSSTTMTRGSASLASALVIARTPFSLRPALRMRPGSARAAGRARIEPGLDLAREGRGGLAAHRPGDVLERARGELGAHGLLGAEHHRVDRAGPVDRPAGRPFAEQRAAPPDLAAVEQRLGPLDRVHHLEDRDLR